MSTTLRHLTLGSCLALLALAPACASLRPPVQNGAPAVSKEGVEVSVLNQRCVQVQQQAWRGDDLVETTVEIRVHNGTPNPITIHPDLVTLAAPDGIAVKTSTWGASDPVTVSGNDTRTLALRYMNRGSLRCGAEMALEPRQAITLDGQPVQLAAVPFTPTHTP